MSLIQILTSVYALPKNSLDNLIHQISIVDYSKGTLLFKEGKREHKAYFIKKGIVRAYARKEEKEITFWFGQEGDIVFPIQTLLVGVEKYTNIELLEDCTLYEMKLNDLLQLYKDDIEIANWGRRYAERACIEMEKLYIGRQFKTLSEIYQELIDHYPSIIQRVPLSIIATYLGIPQVSLSRIRSQVK